MSVVQVRCPQDSPFSVLDYNKYPVLEHHTSMCGGEKKIFYIYYISHLSRFNETAGQHFQPGSYSDLHSQEYNHVFLALFLIEISTEGKQ